MAYSGSATRLPVSSNDNSFHMSGLRAKRRGHEIAVFHAKKQEYCKSSYEVFKKIVQKNSTVYELAYGIAFEYTVEDFTNTSEVVDMRVMSCFAEAFVEWTLGLHTWSKEARWRGACSHSATQEAIKGIPIRQVLILRIALLALMAFLVGFT